MSIVIAKKIDDKIVICSDSAMFRGERRVANNRKKIFKLRDNMYFAGVGSVGDIETFINKLMSFYDEDIAKEVDVKIPDDSPSYDDLRDMLLAVYSVMREEKLLSSQTNFSFIIAIDKDMYMCSLTKDDYEISKMEEEEISKGVAMGMYTENIRVLLDFMHPRDAIKAIYNDGGIYINDVIQEVVIWDIKKYCQAT